MTSFEQVLVRRLRDNPGQPLVTFYDDATGERTELSATTYANWVSKTAGVLVDDLGLDVGDTVASTCHRTGWGRCCSAARGWPASSW